MNNLEFKTYQKGRIGVWGGASSHRRLMRVWGTMW